MVKKLSKLRFLIRNKTLLKTLVHSSKIKNIDCNTINGTNLRGKYHFNYKFDCTRPITFNEIICWLKFNYKNNLWKKCADKLGSKDFLLENGFGKYVVKTYKIYHSSKDIDLDELPNKFVLKTNHDSGTVFVCEKGKTNFNEVFSKLDESIKTKYSSRLGEWVYEDIVPLIFAEEFLETKNDIIDYKLFCFNGKFEWGYTVQNRQVDSRSSLFEKNFEFQNVDYIFLRPRKKDLPPKPDCYDEMINVAEEISKILDFVRVDFYDTIHGPKIGELTFFSMAGFGRFTKKQYDFKFGKCFERTNLFRLINSKKG